MAKYKIAWLPGDGVGVDVMDAARIVLDRIGLDAEYIHGDIGWEFWRTEGDAFPARTIELLEQRRRRDVRRHHLEAAEGRRGRTRRPAEGQGPVYRSPIVRMRQLFDLYICLRPCKAYPGNPLNYKEGLDLVVFRENTEDLYAGVEFSPVPAGAVRDARQAVEGVRAVRRRCRPTTTRCRARSTRERAPSASPARRSSSPASSTARRSPSSTRRTWSARPTTCSSRWRARSHKEFPEIQMDEANIDALTMWLLKNPFNYDVLVAPNLYGDIISDLCAQMVGGLGFGCSGNIGEKLAVFEPTHGSAPKYAGPVQGEPDRHDPHRQDDARLAG